MATTPSDSSASTALSDDSIFPTSDLVLNNPLKGLRSPDSKESLEADYMTTLEQRITDLNKRMETVEHRLFGSFNRVAAAMPKDSDLITAIPRNKGVVAEMLRCLRVIKMHRFATFQCFVLFVIFLAMVSFGIIQILNVDESNDSRYKPFKIQGIDAYYLNEDLDYTIPKHYFLMNLQGSLSDIPKLYNDIFNETCEENIDSCLAKYMDFVLTEPGNPGMTASCNMVAADNFTGLYDTAIIELRNLSIWVDEIGTAKLNGTGYGIFGLLMKLEFETLASHMNGPLNCALQLDMWKMRNMLSGYLIEIYFMISRTDENSWLTLANDDVDSWSWLWRYDDFLFSKNFLYVYDEATFDTRSEFQAEIYVEKKTDGREVTLTIETYPNPTIVHYVSYNNYSYFDWMADMGGLLSLAVGLFLFTATRITKLAHRGKAFQTNHGILPIFSLPHRNAEELARLRFITLESLQITEEQYFGKSFQKCLTVRMKSAERRSGCKKTLMVE